MRGCYHAIQLLLVILRTFPLHVLYSLAAYLEWLFHGIERGLRFSDRPQDMGAFGRVPSASDGVSCVIVVFQNDRHPCPAAFNLRLGVWLVRSTFLLSNCCQ